MGFHGGGGGQLLNHEHDGSLVADGGPLDFRNVTQSSMSAGSITFSDGAHLQERNIGAVSDVLTVAGGVPTWAAAAAGGAVCSNVLVLGTQSRTLCTWLEIGV